MLPGLRPNCVPSFILIYLAVWPQYTNITDRQDRPTGQRSDSIGLTVLQTVVQKLNFFGHPGGRSNLSPTKLGVVIEDFEHVLGPRKLLGVCYGGLKIPGKPIPLNLKPLQLHNPLSKSIQILTANAS